MPVSALIDKKILCMHGGLSRDLHSLYQINNLQRPTTITDYGLMSDIIFSKYSDFIFGWDDNNVGVSLDFGK